MAAPLGELAYEALRLAFVPWQRERRLAKERERTRIARLSSSGLVATGFAHSLARRVDSGIAFWGSNGDGQAPPGGVDGEFVAVTAGAYHSLAIRRDGSIACWGENGFGQAPPDGVVGDFVAIAAGWRRSLALRRDGGIACLGFNSWGQAPPDGVTFMTQEL